MASASGCENAASTIPSGKTERPSVGSFRQATLDCCVKKIAKTYDGTSFGRNQVDDHTHHDGIFDDSDIHAQNGAHLNHLHTTTTARGQNVAIDLEAAKTWVYPSYCLLPYLFLAHLLFFSVFYVIFFYSILFISKFIFLIFEFVILKRHRYIYNLTEDITVHQFTLEWVLASFYNFTFL